VAQEFPLTVFVNGREIVTLLCTPQKLNYLILGFLYFQGLIQKVEDVVSISVCPDQPTAQVRLLTKKVVLHRRRVVFSGCGSTPAPANSSHPIPPLESTFQARGEDLVSLMSYLQEGAELYRAHGGVHISGLADRDKLLVLAEDIGRHNTLDKIQGECLYRGLSTQDRILLTTGRLSSEMVDKAVRMGVPVLVSRNSPTERAAVMADHFGMTLVGYLRGPRLVVYTHPERVVGLST